MSSTEPSYRIQVTRIQLTEALIELVGVMNIEDGITMGRSQRMGGRERVCVYQTASTQYTGVCYHGTYGTNPIIYLIKSNRNENKTIVPIEWRRNKLGHWKRVGTQLSQ